MLVLRKCFLIILFFSIFLFPCFSDLPDSSNSSLLVNWPFRNTAPDDLTIKLAIVGPGEEFFLWFGHTGLVVEDSVRGESYFYDFGVFSFDEEFFSNFFFGKFIYSVESTKFIYYIMHIKRINRSIHTLTLNIDPEIKVELAKALYINALPPNKEYKYRHFDNNCSTKIRDYIDFAVYGQLKESTDVPSRMTLREHLRRHTYHNFFTDWIYMFILSGGVDFPSTAWEFTVWEEMYIPSEIERNIINFSYINVEGESVPLVSRSEMIFEAVGREPVLENYIELWPQGLIFGLILAIIPVILSIIYIKFDKLRILLGLYTCIISFIFGILGSLLFFMNYFTEHFVMYNNENLFILNPITLAVFPLAILFLLNKKSASKLLFIAWSVLSFMGIVMIILKLFGVFHQSNLIIIVTCMLFNFGFAGSYFLIFLSEKADKKNYLSNS